MTIELVIIDENPLYGGEAITLHLDENRLPKYLKTYEDDPTARISRSDDTHIVVRHNSKDDPPPPGYNMITGEKI